MKDLGFINEKLLKFAPKGFRWIYVFSYNKYLKYPENGKSYTDGARTHYKSGQAYRSSVFGRVNQQPNSSTPEQIIILRAYLVPENVTDHHIHSLIIQHNGIHVSDIMCIAENTTTRCGEEWYITELSTIDKIIKTIDNSKTVYKANKMILSEYANNHIQEENDKNEFKDFWEYISKTKIINKEDEYIIKSIYVNFINTIRKYNEYYRWDNFFTEELGKSCLYNDVNFRYIFKSFSPKYNLETLDSYEIDIKSIFDKLFKKIKEDKILNTSAVYDGIEFDENNKEFNTFITTLYVDTHVKKHIDNLNIKIGQSAALYRVSIDVIDNIIDQKYKNYIGSKDSEFYNKALSDITIFVDSDFMYIIWKSLIFSKYREYNIIDSINIEKIDKNKLIDMPKFDYIIQNPPYSGDLHLDFLKMGLNMLNEKGQMIIIEPATFLISPHNVKRYNEIKDLINGNVKSVTIASLNSKFNTGLYVPFSIMHIDKSNNYDKIFFTCYDEGKFVNSLYDCNLIGDNNIIESIKNKINNKCKEALEKYHYNDNEEYNDNVAFIRYMFKMTLHPYKIESVDTIYDDVNDMTFNQSYMVYGAHKHDNVPVKQSKIKDNWKCIYCDKFDNFEDNKKFLENFVDFTRHTKFAHYIGIRYIVSQNNYSHKYVPYLDFSHKWTDEMLYKFFDLSDDEIKLIEDTCDKFEWHSDWYKKFREFKD